MFESTLKTKLKAIFGLPKVTYDTHGPMGQGDKASDSREQETLFVEIQEVTSTIKEGVATARVVARCSVFGVSEKIPYGFFAKRIQAAPVELTKDFFFYDLEKNSNFFVNVTERSFSFLYLFTSQYDPNHGNLTDIEVTE